MNERLFTTREAAEFLGVKEATLIAWRARRTPNRPQPVIVGGRSVRYPESGLREYVERQSALRPWPAN